MLGPSHSDGLKQEAKDCFVRARIPDESGVGVAN
jgi:hypothetical protein